MKILNRILVVVWSALITASCATTTVSERDAANVTTKMLLSGNSINATHFSELTPDSKVLELTPEMIAFLEYNVDEKKWEYFRLRELLHAIIVDNDFEIIYDDITRTASETFRDRRGNCLSFTNMFIAMARHLGLNAQFQEVEIPPDWSMDGQSFVLSQHVNAYLELGPYSRKVVDFNIEDFKTSYEMRQISDQRALAHYFNNIGVEQMLDGMHGKALANFRRSIESDVEFAAVWINLGVLYRRESKPVYAEAAFLKALDVDSKNMVAMSNLSNLYKAQGEMTLSELYQQRVNKHRMQNPYYRYMLAQKSYDAERYAEAVDHLKVAIRHQKADDGFYFLLGLSYFKLGDETAGQEWMNKAMETAEKASLRRAYGSKLDLLLSSMGE